MEACSFWLMLLSLLLLLLSPLLAFLLLSLFFISWFLSVRSPLFAFPGLPCAVRPLELCPPVLVFLSGLYSLSFVFVCPLFTSLFSGFFPPLFVFSLFSVIFLSFRKKPPLVRSLLLWFFRFALPSLPPPPSLFVVFSLNVLSFCPDNDHGGEAYFEMHRVGDVVHDCNRFEAVSFLLN